MSDHDSTLRFCPKCQEVTARNTQGACKPCAAARSAAWRAANPDKTRAYTVANPDRMKANYAAYAAANPDNNKERQAAFRKANPEVVRITNQNQRARRRASGGKLSKDLAAKLFEDQRGLCACCKDPLGEDFHLDHVLPLALGGTNTDDNMQLLRKRCNLQKGSRHPDEFMQEREFDILWNR